MMTFRKLCENSSMDSRIQYSNDVKEVSKEILGTVSGWHAIA